MKTLNRSLVRPCFLLILVCLVSCGGLPQSNVMPSENQGECPGSRTTIYGNAQMGARITIHLTETGQQLGSVTVGSDGEFRIGPVTSGYDYTLAITGRWGGYEVKHYFIGCAIPEWHVKFDQYVWDPSQASDLADIASGHDTCDDYKGTPALCDAVVYDEDNDQDWIDGSRLRDRSDRTKSPLPNPLDVTSLEEPYTALFLKYVEIHNNRTDDKTIGGPDGPYGDISALFIPNTEENRQAMESSLKNPIIS